MPATCTRLEPVAQGGSTFERKRIGRLLHLFLRIARERVIPTFEEEHALIDRAAVLVPRCVPHARRGAPLEVEQEAGATARQRRRGYGASAPVFARDDVQLAGTVRKEFLQEIERLVHGLGIRERSEVAGAAVADRKSV